ncbi:MAG: hypothetical protein ABIB46_03290 [bacterium]
MYPSQHFFLGLIFSFTLFLIFPEISVIGFILVLASSVLVDFDHYAYYVYRKKDFNLKRAYIFGVKAAKKFLSLPKNKQRKFHTGFNFFHGIEIILILLVLGIFVHKYFLFISTGITFHFFLDIIFEKKVGGKIKPLFVTQAFFRTRKLKFIENI